MTTGQRIGHIYKMYHESKPELFYVGSTSLTMEARLSVHRCHGRMPVPKTKWQKYMKEHECDGFVMEQLEQVNYTNLSDLRKREQYYVDLLKPQMNSIKAFDAKIPRECEYCGYKTVYESAMNLHNNTAMHKLYVSMGHKRPISPSSA
jgi:hypothetical protein